MRPPINDISIQKIKEAVICTFVYTNKRFFLHTVCTNKRLFVLTYVRKVNNSPHPAPNRRCDALRDWNQNYLMWVSKIHSLTHSLYSAPTTTRLSYWCWQSVYKRICSKRKYKYLCTNRRLFVHTVSTNSLLVVLTVCTNNRLLVHRVGANIHFQKSMVHLS